MACETYNPDQKCLVDRFTSATALTKLRSSNITDEEFTQIAINFMEDAIASCTNVCVDHARPLRVLVYQAVAPISGLLAAALQKDYSTSLVVKVVEEKALVHEIASNIKAGQTGMDLWLLPTNGLGDVVAARDGDFGSDVQNEAFLSNGGELLQLHPAAAALYTYNSSVMGVPTGYDLPYLYYRMDFFAAYNLTVPSTWDEMVDIAELFNGTDIDGDGEPDRSLCLNAAQHNFLLEHVLGTMTQTRGMASGHLIDPETMRPLVNNPAMERALNLVARLLRNACGYTATEKSMFNEGKCIMSIGTASTFKGWSLLNSSVKAEHYGIAMPPGSKEVLDRSSMQLVPCARGLCSDYNAKQEVYFNRAPNHGTGGMSVSTNPTLPAAYQDIAALTFFRGIDAVGGPVSRYVLTTPVDEKFLDPSDEGLQPWLMQGYDRRIALRFVSVSRQILNHPNLGMELRIPLRDSYIDVLRKVVYAPGFSDGSIGSFAGRSMVSGASAHSRHLEQSYSAVMAHIEDEFIKILHEDTANVQLAASIYRTAMGWTSVSDAKEDTGSAPGTIVIDEGHPVSDSTSTLIIAIVVPIISVTLILLGAAYVYKSRKSNTHSWMGAVMAPLPGPETSLMITDIEGSTTLWERLPAEVMSVVVNVHHGVMRAHLSSCSGYESATEGDSFLIVFHTPTDAVRFAVKVQAAMLRAPWPQELLDLPQCAPQYLTCIPKLDYLISKSPSEQPTGTDGAAQVKPCSTGVRISQEDIVDPAMSDYYDCSLPPTALDHSTRDFNDNSLLHTLQYNNLISLGCAAASTSLHASRDSRPTFPTPTQLTIGFTDRSSMPQLDSGNYNTSPSMKHNMSGTSINTLPYEEIKRSRRDSQLSEDTILGEDSCRTEICRSEVIPESPRNLIGMSSRTEIYRSEVIPESPHNSDSTPATSTPATSIPATSIPATSIPAISTLHDFLMSFQTAVFGDHSRSAAEPNGPSTSQSLLIWRGVRVRMGIHSGVSEDTDAVMNKVSGRMEYGGSLLELAHAVEGAAAGGVVLLTEQTFKLLGRLQEAVVAHAGLCSLKSASGPRSMTVMQVLDQILLHRCATLKPLTPLLQLEPGFLQTPFGQGTICFMSVGDTQFKALEKEARTKIMDKWQSIAREDLIKHGGYLLEATKNLVLASFLGPSAAIRWALNTRSLPQSINIEEVSGQQVPGVEKGLLIKCGLDQGPHRSFLNPVSGRIEHRGKVMNRSARICMFAKSGDVCCSQSAWLLATREMGYHEGVANGREQQAFPKRGSSWANMKCYMGSVAKLNRHLTPSSLSRQLSSSPAISRERNSPPGSAFQREMSSDLLAKAEGEGITLQGELPMSASGILTRKDELAACEGVELRKGSSPTQQGKSSSVCSFPEASSAAGRFFKSIIATNLGSTRLKGIQGEVVIMKLQLKLNLPL